MPRAKYTVMNERDLAPAHMELSLVDEADNKQANKCRIVNCYLLFNKRAERDNNRAKLGCPREGFL